MGLLPTASQTVGPFFHLCLTRNEPLGQMAGADVDGERVQLVCRVLDGDGVPVNDALIELWQADAQGRYNHPAFCGFGRLATDENGTCIFETIKPGCVASKDQPRQASHINVSIFARGLLNRLVTRIYFAGDSANDHDPILALVPEDRRGTLLANPDPAHPGVWNFDVRLSAECETVFFDV